MDDLKLITYRYMWKISGDKSLKFKIVTDLPAAHELYVDNLIKYTDDLESFGREYVCEYSCSNIGLFEKLYKKEVK